MNLIFSPEFEFQHWTFQPWLTLIQQLKALQYLDTDFQGHYKDTWLNGIWVSLILHNDPDGKFVGVAKCLMGDKKVSRPTCIYSRMSSGRLP